jgi:hypothetical protein
MIIYTDLATQIMTDMAVHLRDFEHLDPGRIAILSAARASGHPNGNLATCHGLSEEPDSTFSIWVAPDTYRITAVSRWFHRRNPRIRLAGQEISYLILLRLPRLLLSDPLATLVHELYHISPRFDRKMRPARHGPLFDREVNRITRTWLRQRPSDLTRLARMNLRQLQAAFGAVLARGLPRNFVIPVLDPSPAPQSYENGVKRLYPGYRLASVFRVRPGPVSTPDALRLLTEDDLVMRHYSSRGAQKLPTALARYSSRIPVTGSSRT